jgi:hypothetical protein
MISAKPTNDDKESQRISAKLTNDDTESQRFSATKAVDPIKFDQCPNLTHEAAKNPND